MNAPRIDGIDTSGYQTIVGDQPPLLFAIAKATEGQRTVDRKFFGSVEHYQAQPHIETVGGYGWLRPDSPARKQAEFFLSTIAKCPKPLDFAVCDWERTSGQPTFPTCEEAEEWCEIVGSRLPTLMYSAPWVPDFRRWRGRNSTFPLITANYVVNPASPNYGLAQARAYHATAWQFTSTATVSGFTGRVDASMALQPDWFRALIPTAPTIPTEEPDMRVVRIYEADGVTPADDAQFIVGPLTLTHITEAERKTAIDTGIVSVHPSGRAWKLGRDKLSDFELVGKLPAGCKLSPSEFRAPR